MTGTTAFELPMQPHTSERNKFPTAERKEQVGIASSATLHLRDKECHTCTTHASQEIDVFFRSLLTPFDSYDSNQPVCIHKMLLYAHNQDIPWSREACARSLCSTVYSDNGCKTGDCHATALPVEKSAIPNYKQQAILHRMQTFMLECSGCTEQHIKSNRRHSTHTKSHPGSHRAISWSIDNYHLFLVSSTLRFVAERLRDPVMHDRIKHAWCADWFPTDIEMQNVLNVHTSTFKRKAFWWNGTWNMYIRASLHEQWAIVRFLDILYICCKNAIISTYAHIQPPCNITNKSQHMFPHNNVHDFTPNSFKQACRHLELLSEHGRNFANIDPALVFDILKQYLLDYVE